jgi:hypothetical protein
VVQEALSGLPGVIKPVQWDWKNDLLHVRYDPEQITPETLLEAVAKQGFKGKLVPNDR